MQTRHKIGTQIAELYRSPSPRDIYAFSPGICTLPGGRLVATMDLGGKGVTEKHTGKIFLSDDGGNNWRHVADASFRHARPFVAGNAVYVLGHAVDLVILRSDDQGETWSAPTRLTEGQQWHQGAP